jgi:hypothetical protein
MNRFIRRGALAPGILLYALSAAAGANVQTWTFQVYLDDAAIGHHHFVLNDKGAEQELTTDARFNVRLLFINAYRYAHDASERWRGNCLVSLAARTDDNGKQSVVNAERRGERVHIVSPRGSVAVDGCVMSFAYWNPDILRQTRLLNAQTGQYEAVRIAALGDEQIMVRGAPVQARRYRISGPKNPIDLWYGAGPRWLALQSTLDGGRTLRYQLK